MADIEGDALAATDGFCAVCQEDIVKPAPSSTTPCGHVFHFGCLARHMIANKTCPVCRKDVLVQSDGSCASESEADDLSDDSDVESIEIEISGSNTSGQTFQEMVNQLGHLTDAHEVSLDVYVSSTPRTDSNTDPPPPPRILPPTPANIIHYIKTGNVSEVENMLLHDSSLVRTSDDDGDTLLHVAAMAQNEYLMRYLVTHAEMPTNSTNKARMTPLHYAVFTSNIRIVCLALNLGCFVDPGDASGKTPLMYAVMHNNTEIVELLFQRGADVNTPDMVGDTALHYAGRSGSVSCFRALSIFRRFHVDVANSLGETPMHLASGSGSHPCVRFLIISGANTVKKTKAGKTPSDYVAANNSNLLRLLRGDALA